MSEILKVNESVLAELISRRWQEHQPYFTLGSEAGPRGSWWQRAMSGAPEVQRIGGRPALQVQTLFTTIAL